MAGGAENVPGLKRNTEDTGAWTSQRKKFKEWVGVAQWQSISLVSWWSQVRVLSPTPSSEPQVLSFLQCAGPSFKWQDAARSCAEDAGSNPVGPAPPNILGARNFSGDPSKIESRLLCEVHAR